jgi:hypothetical protein
MRRFDMRVSLAVCFAAMIWGTVAHAGPEITYFANVGSVGSNSCGKLIAAVGKYGFPGKKQVLDNTDYGRFVSENSEYQQWLLGFVSGFNAAHASEPDKQATGIDQAGMDLWMRNWCNKNPTKTVFDGANAFIDEMRGNAAAPANDK